MNVANIFGIARRELSTFFNSPIAYVVLGVFLLVAGWLYFWFSGLFIVGVASLRNFFGVAPLLFMFLAPAITMRLLAEERKSGTIELLMTLPVREGEVVVAKWLAAVVMMSVGLLFTLSYPITLSLLAADGAHLDLGPIIGGYLGCVLMAGAFAAVGSWTSAMSENQIVAFIFGLVVCFLLWVLDKTALIHPGIGEVLEWLSVNYHFESVARGVIDVRDLLYYATVITLFLLLSTSTLRALRTPRGSFRPVEIVAFASLVLLNVIALQFPKRFDLTRDKQYTLAAATKETLDKLEAPVKVTAYFSKDLPPPFSQHARYTMDLLEEFHAASHGQLSFELVDPQEQETEEDKEKKREIKRDIFGRAVREKTSVEQELEGLGIQPVEVREFKEDQAQTRRAYMGIAVRYGEEKEAIPVVQDTSTLEYDLTSMIRRLVRTKLPVIGVVQGHGEPSLHEGLQKLDTLLKQNYELRAVNLSSPIGDDIDALLIVGPQQGFTPDEKNTIDAYLMKGKAAGFFLDRFQVDLKTFQPTPNEQNLDDLVGAYGVELGSQLVGDVDCASLNVQERRGFMIITMPLKYPFIPQPRALEGSSPLTKGLGDVTLPFVAPLYPKSGMEGVEVQVLAKSSSKSWLEDGDAENLNPRRDWANASIGFTGPYNLVATARGALPSFADGSKKSAGEARVIVVGTSMFLNEQIFTQQNAALIFNMIDWLSLDAKLLEMRTRSFNDAPFKPELSDGARNAAKVVNTAGVPALLVIFGLIRWRLREARRRQLAVVTP